MDTDERGLTPKVPGTLPIPRTVRIRDKGEEGEIGEEKGELGEEKGGMGEEKGEMREEKGEMREEKGEMGEEKGEMEEDKGELARNAPRSVRDGGWLMPNAGRFAASPCLPLAASRRSPRL